MAKTNTLKAKRGVLIPEQFPDEVSVLQATSANRFFAVRVTLYAGSAGRRAVAEQRTPLFLWESEAMDARTQALTLGWGVTAVIVEFAVVE